jgi:hypothetical protein
MTRKIFILALVAMLAMTLAASAFPFHDVDAIIHSHGDLVMRCDGQTVTLLDLGTTPRDVGGLRIMTRSTDENGFVHGQDVTGPLPYTKVLDGDPYWEAVDGVDEVQPGYFKFRFDIPLTTPLETGTALVLTNGVGIYARCTVS